MEAKIIKAGKIAAEVLEYGAVLIKLGANALSVIDKTELEIKRLNAKPAFPVQIAINNIAAHCIPEKEIVFHEDDVVKLDVGVQVNGWIGDNARTIVFNNENKKIAEAAEKALESALKIIKPGIELGEIGGVIEQVIAGYGFKSVKNLSGHLLERYEQHAGLTIPNFDNKDRTKLEDGMLVAIEPFATNGVGLIEERKDSGIFKVVNIKNVRDNNARELLRFIINEYNALPFSRRWLLGKFPEFKVSFGLRLLKREGVLHEYSQLWEKGSGLVSQAEHTVLVKDPIIVTTRKI